MRIAVVGHSYHLKTRSNAFFLELVRRLGEVETFVDASWELPVGAAAERHSGSEWARELRQDDFDCVVVYQVHEAFGQLDLDHPNVVFVPMYDSMLVDGELWWTPEFGRAKVLCFSAALYREVTPLAPLRHYAQYFPDPRDYPAAAAAEGAPSAFFWYRRSTIDAELVARLAGDTVFERWTLHWAPDPVGEHHEPRRQPRARALRRTSWFPDRASYLAELARHGVYFASRPDEGLGIAFLEAMAMGLCVVAPARPTHDEYLSHGADGLLYPLAAPRPLDFSRHRELGRRARERVARGRELWERAEADVLEFLVKPTAELGRRRAVIDFFCGSQGAAASVVHGEVPWPKVTVVTVCLNAADTLEATLASVLEQEYPDFEYLVLDGGSSDGTVEILERHASRLAYWRSRPDQRAYDAMLEALDYAHGQYVLYMNAGDVFVSRRALATLFASAPADADVIHGHHLFVDVHGVDELRLAGELETIGSDLERGQLDLAWLRRIPCHQSTAVRVELLREHGFDPELQLAADHDLYFRLRRAGARFHLTPEPIAVYRGGGASHRHFDLCVQEWLRLAVRHGRSGAARRFYRQSQLAPEQVWSATLHGWSDRLRRRAERRFGSPGAPDSASATAAGRPLASRLREGVVELLARMLGAGRRLLRRPAAVDRQFASPVERGGSAIYRAQLDEGIDFRRHGRPQFVRRWTGLSFREPWGRWSVGPQVEILFEEPLPEHFELVVTASAIGENCRLPIRIRIGEVSREIWLTNDATSSPSLPCGAPEQSPIRTVAVEVESSGQERALLFEIPRPISPAELRPGTTNDRRALGVGFQSLRIEPR